MTSKIIVRVYQDPHRDSEDSRICKVEIVGTFPNKFDAEFFLEQAKKEKHYGWSEMINEHYLMFDVFTKEKGGTIKCED